MHLNPGVKVKNTQTQKGMGKRIGDFVSYLSHLLLPAVNLILAQGMSVTLVMLYFYVHLNLSAGVTGGSFHPFLPFHPMTACGNCTFH